MVAKLIGSVKDARFFDIKQFTKIVKTYLKLEFTYHQHSTYLIDIARHSILILEPPTGRAREEGRNRREGRGERPRVGWSASHRSGVPVTLFIFGDISCIYS